MLEEPLTPLGVQRVDRVLAVGGANGLEDSEHPVREGVGGDRAFAVRLGHGRCDAIVVADLEAIRLPGHVEIPLRGDLFDPAGGDPRPRTTRIHVELDGGHGQSYGASGGSSPSSPLRLSGTSMACSRRASRVTMSRARSWVEARTTWAAAPS